MKKLSILLSFMMAGMFVFGQTYLISDPAGEATTCSGTFYDSGATGNYSNNENYTFTFYPSPGAVIQVNFTSFSTHNHKDVLSIYDGENTSAPLIGSYYGKNSNPGLITASTGPLTFHFISDDKQTDAGWVATISCSLGPYNNDDCANAYPINEVTDLVFNTNVATSSGKTPSCTSQAPIDLWFAYTATSTGNGYFDLCGSGFKTILAVWESCGSTTSLACNKTNGPICAGQQSSLIYPVTEGTTYYVQVGGHNGNATGIGDLTIQVEPLRWTGLTSTDWGTSTNWVGNNVPDINTDVIIPSTPIGGNFPETNSLDGAECNNLTIETGAHVHVPADNSLTVGTTLTNQAGVDGLLLMADADGMASLLHNTPNVAATVEEYLTSEVWHYVSSPISNAQINVYFDIYFYSFNEFNNTWNNVWDPITAPMNVAQGYKVWASDLYTGPTAVSYAGTLNNGDYTLDPLSFTSGSPSVGWNLIGNPFASPIQVNDNWTYSDVSWVCVYNSVTGEDECYNITDGTYDPPGGFTDGIISSTQGFFIKATSATASITIPQSERLHSSQPFYKDAAVEINENIRLQVEGNNGTDEVLVQFHADASEGYDGRYDLDKFFKYENKPQIFAYAQEKEYAVKVLPELTDGRIVPLGIEADEPGIFTLRIYEYEGIDADLNLYLEDLADNSITQLTEDSEHSFAADPGDNAHRFNLHFKSGAADMDGESGADIRIYAHDNVVYIQQPDGFNGPVHIYNMMGQEVLSGTGTGQGLLNLTVDSRSGFYVVKMQHAGEVITRKVYIK